MASIILKNVGMNKVKVIKLVRELSGMGLKETKEAIDLVEKGTELKIDGISTEKMMDIINEFSNIGARVVEVRQDMQKQMKFEPIVSASSVVSSDREETMQILLEVKKIAENFEIYNHDILALQKKLRDELDKVEEIKNRLSPKARMIIVCSTLISAFIGFSVGTFIGAIVFVIICSIIMNCTIKKSDLRKNGNKNNIEAEQYIQSNIEPLRIKLNKLYDLRDELINTGKKEWAIDIVGEDMFYSACINDLYNLVKTRRADSIKEALNKYDDIQYKTRMEEMQTSIQNASEVSALESVKQTGQMKKIEKNTNQIARNTRKR